MLARLTLIALSAAITTPVLAEEEKPARKPRDPARMQKMLDEFDLDGDGELNQQERTAAREAREARRGEKGKGEARKGRRRGGFRGPRMDPDKMFNSLDTNGDGQLTREEFSGLTQLMREKAERRGGPGQRGRRGPRGGQERPESPPVEEDTPES